MMVEKRIDEGGELSTKLHVSHLSISDITHIQWVQISQCFKAKKKNKGKTVRILGNLGSTCRPKVHT